MSYLQGEIIGRAIPLSGAREQIGDIGSESGWKLPALLKESRKKLIIS